jgi:hypothetical protein
MGEFDAVRREPIKVRRAHLGVGEAAQVSVAEVIAQEDNDVGLFGRDDGAASQCEQPKHGKIERSKVIDQLRT